MADEDPAFKPGSSFSFGKVRRKVAVKSDDVPELATWDLQEGYRILLELMKVTKCFLEAPDLNQKGMGDYFEVIEKPMWFLEMRRKFEEKEYNKISEFVSDVRLMLLNCYRFFGPLAYQTKRALAVENRLEQKLALLPEEFRSQCALEATNGPIEDTEEGVEVQSRLLHSVRTERFQREKERRKKLADERKAEQEGKDSDVLQWEREVLFQGDAHVLMVSMWELPVIGHFVSLGLEHLNIDEVPQFEIERIFLMPQASRSLSIIMTTLLSPPMTRVKLPNKPPMPYKIWTRKLKQKVTLWYKMYAKSSNNADLMFEKFGIEHQFWKIIGNVNPLEEYEFHELSFHQRVWIIKTVCDYLLQHQKILRDLLAGQAENFGNCLGMDRLGAKFLYFRQFFGQDVRVYRQAPDPPSWIERDLEYQAEFEATSMLDGLPKMKKVRRKKKGRGAPAKASEVRNSSSKNKTIIQRDWKHGKLKELNKGSSSSNQSSSSKTQIDEDSPPVLTNSETGEWEQPAVDLSPPVLHKETSPLKTSSLETPVNGDKRSTVHNEYKQCDTNITVEEEKEKCDLNNKVEEVQGKCDIVNTVEENKMDSDNVNKVESKLDSDKCVNRPDAKRNSIDVNQLKAEWTEEVIDSKPSTPSNPQTEVADTKEIEIKAARKPLYDPHWLRPSPDDFLLVADSVDGVRELLAKYCDDDLELIQRINNAKTGRHSRPTCEIKLARRLNELIIELEPCELKSVTDTKKCRRKLYDEWHAFQNRPEDYVDADETFWLNEKEHVEVPEETPVDEATNGLPLEQEGTVTSSEGAFTSNEGAVVSQEGEGVEGTLNGILKIAPEEVSDASLDAPRSTGRQRSLRNRRSTLGSFIALWADKEEGSIESETDSDNSDLWEVSKKKRKRKPRLSKVITDEEGCDSAKPKKQQKKKDKSAPEDISSDQNLSTSTLPATAFEGAFTAWIGGSKKENNNAESKKSTELYDNEDSSNTASEAGKHPASAANVRKKLFSENTNRTSVSEATSCTVSTTISNSGSSTKVSCNTSTVLKYMAQNFAEPETAHVPALARSKTSGGAGATKNSASKTTAAVEEVVILSDDSDDEIQFVGVHNPPPVESKPPRTKLVLQQYAPSVLGQGNARQTAVTSRPVHPAGTQFNTIGPTSSLPRIASVESVAPPTASARYTQQAKRRTITSASTQQHSTQNVMAHKSSNNTSLSTPPSKVAQPVVVGTIGSSSILLTSPQQPSPTSSQRKQRTQPTLHTSLTSVIQPTPATHHSPSQTVAHTPTQVMLSPLQTATMRSPSQVSVNSPPVLPVGTELTLRPSSVHSQVQVSSPLQATRFSSPGGRMPTSAAATPPNVGNIAQVAGGTRATLVVVPGDGNTASNYALAFSNGTRMILTPEQVAQIRAENNGVLGTGNFSGIFSQ